MRAGTTIMQTGAPLEKAAAICVVVHGRGQSPAAMQEHIVARLKVPDICFLLPAAPGGSWYDARAIEPLSDTTRRQLQQSLLIISAAMAQAKTSGKSVMLIDFSQGACLSMEYAFANGGWKGAMAAGEFGAAKARLRCDVFPGRAHEVSATEINVVDEMFAAQTTAEERFWP
jgi:phospholipase/carboxylesterase